MTKKSFFCFFQFLSFIYFSVNNAMPEMPMDVGQQQPIAPVDIQPMPVDPMPIQPMPVEQMPMQQPPVAQPMSISPVPVVDQMPMDTQAVPAGPQTVSLEESKVGVRGNWVKKREWLKQSQEVNNEIQSLVDQIQQSKSSFINKITQADNELDSFYRQIGFKQGELQATFDGLQNYLNEKRAKRIAQVKASGNGEGVTSEMEIKIDIIEDEVKNLKNSLEQFKLDMKSIQELDKLLQEHLKVLDEQINLTISDAGYANQLVDDIWNMIDDKKARTAYYTLTGDVLEKVKVSKNYVQATLLNNLDSVVSTIRTQIAQIRNEIVNLESNGFIIKNRAKRIEKLKLQELELLKAGQPIPSSDIEKEKKDIERKNKIYDFFVGMAANVYRFYKHIINFFVNEVAVETVQ